MKKLFTALLTICLLAGVWCAPAWAAATQFGTSNISYQLGTGRNCVRTSAGTLYAIVCNGTNDKIEAWEYSSGNWGSSPVGTSPTGSYSCACTIDGNNIIQVIYYNGTAVVCNTFTTSSNSWGTPTTIYTKTAGGSYGLAIAVDANNIPHVMFNDYASSTNELYYANKVGGSWNTPIEVSSDNCSRLDIAIDTTNSGSHRYNLPQLAWYDATTNMMTAGLGQSNNPTSAGQFTIVKPAQSVSNSNLSLTIDINGTTNIMCWNSVSPYYIQVTRISPTNPDSNWGTAANWTTSNNCFNNTASVGYVAMAVSGVNRYGLVFYTSTNTIYKDYSFNYGNWGAQTQTTDSPTTHSYMNCRWSYANCPSYQTYGLDYLWLNGTGTGNLYWNNYVPPLPGSLMVHLRKFLDSFFPGKALAQSLGRNPGGAAGGR